jgi:hypothetical protein
MPGLHQHGHLTKLPSCKLDVRHVMCFVSLQRYEKQRTGGFGTNPLRQTVLGQMRNDRTYNQLYSVTGNNCGDNKQQPCLS